MTNKLLYFPYIDIPKSNWTVKSLLYWDKVGIIVPPSYMDKPKQYRDFTIELLKTDLIEQIFPGEYIWQVKKFDKGFIKLVDQPKFNLKSRQRDFGAGIHSRIHVQKFGEELLNHLVDLKIAKRKDWTWFHVETRSANLIMLYLATVVSKVGEFTPATDDLGNLDTSVSQKGFSMKLNKTRQKLLNNLMPYPIEPNLTKLRKFKDKYHEELTSFRILIEQTSYELTKFSKMDRKESLSLKVAEINDKRDKILSELNQGKLGQITFGTICGVAGAIVSFEQDNKPLALFSLANAIYSAFQGYDKQATLTKDYSYLALVDKTFRLE
jgi:hypothetical protein